jgi:hypothetical protein
LCIAIIAKIARIAEIDFLIQGTKFWQFRNAGDFGNPLVSVGLAIAAMRALHRRLNQAGTVGRWHGPAVVARVLHQREWHMNGRFGRLAQPSGDGLTNELAHRLFVHHSESL